MSAELSRSFDGTEIRTGDEVLTVRCLRPEHLEALIAFDAGLGDDTRRLFSPHGYDRPTVWEYIERSERDVDVSYVAMTAAGRIVAYFFLWEADLDVPLLGIGITDDYQNRGLGSRLMQILIETARGLGKLGIDLTTMQDNDRAFHVYRSCGFEYLGDVPNLTGDGRTVIERRLFLPLAEGAVAPERSYGPPDQIAH